MYGCRCASAALQPSPGSVAVFESCNVGAGVLAGPLAVSALQGPATPSWQRRRRLATMHHEGIAGECVPGRQ